MASDQSHTDLDMPSREEHVASHPLVELLTPGARVRILLALMSVKGEKLNPSSICEHAAIHHDTWYEHRDTLVDVYGVIEEAEPAGNSPMYRVDMDDPIISHLWEIYGEAGSRRLAWKEAQTDADGDGEDDSHE